MKANEEAILPFVDLLESHDALFIYLVGLIENRIKLKSNHYKITPKIFSREGAREFIVNELLYFRIPSSKYYSIPSDISNKEYFMNLTRFCSSSVRAEYSSTMERFHQEWMNYIDKNLYDANDNIDAKDEFRKFLEENNCMEKFIINFTYRNDCRYGDKPIDIIKDLVANKIITYDTLIKSNETFNLLKSGREFYGELINNSFTWSRTPEGHFYWQEKDRKLKEYFKETIDLRWR